MKAVPVGIALGLVIGACFVKPDAPSDQHDSGIADTLTDGVPSDVGLDASSDLCVVSDDFMSGGSGCGSAAGIGSGSGSQTILRQGGVLRMSTPGGGEYSRCQSTGTLWRTVTIQIPQRLTSLNGATGVVLSFNNSEHLTLQLASSGTVTAQVNNDLVDTIFLTDETYFRFRRSGATVLVDWSRDKGMWSNPPKTYQLASEPTAVAVQLFVTYGGTQSGSASFDNLDACSP